MSYKRPKIKVQKLILTLLTNISMKSSSETGHLSWNYRWSNFLFCFTKFLYKSTSLNVVMMKIPIIESYIRMKPEGF